MVNNDYKSIQKHVEVLKEKVLATWKKKEKWDRDVETAPFNGLESDPVFNLLLTAIVYQSNLIRDDIDGFKEEIINEYFDRMLPYWLVRPVPAMAMMETMPSKNNGSCFVDESTKIVIKKQYNKSKQAFSFYPLIKTKIVDANIKSIKKLDCNRWDVNVCFKNQEDSIGSVSFFIRDVYFKDLNVYINGDKVKLIKPWDYDKMQLNGFFSSANMLYNSSLLYGADEQWLEMMVESGFAVFMIDPSYDYPIGTNSLNMTLELDGGSVDAEIDEKNLRINCFPIVNVILNHNNSSEPFTLSRSEPIKKIANECQFDVQYADMHEMPAFFMNLIKLDENECDDRDRFVLRRFGAERFNMRELLVLAKKLCHRYHSDFYAFQDIDELNNSSYMQKLDVALKDVLKIIQENGEAESGIYAILKHNDNNDYGDYAININALFTNGAFANDIQAGSAINVPQYLNKSETRLLCETKYGRNPETSSDVKYQLAKYYALTNDRIVTRMDIKAFVIKHLVSVGFKPDDILSFEFSNCLVEDSFVQNVVVNLSSCPLGYDVGKLTAFEKYVDRLINLKSACGISIKISFKVN